MEGELSEGEIVSSSDGELPAALQPSTAKKPKRGALEDSRAPMDPLAPHSSSANPLRKREKKLKKRTRRASSSKKTAAQLSRMPVDCVTNAFRKREIQDTLSLLANLSQGQGSISAPPSASLPLLKTVSFQSVILQLVTKGSPELELQASELLSLRENRVVVVWLSLVSAELFNREEYFKKVKSLQPCVQFLIEHPGSQKYVKLGLEAFLLRQRGKEEEGKQYGKPHENSGGEFSRANCLLSLLEMEENGFPLSQSLVKDCTEKGKDLSDYLQLADWSEREACLCDNSILRFPMFAVDCEMVETSKGLELARVSIVNESLECIYDTLVKPDLPVLDYKTKFSGINEETLAPVTTSLRDVHQKLSMILPSRCILLGHSLENDLHALRLSHPHVIDTSCLFTPYASPRSKPSLRLIARKLLSKDIQSETSGHCSIEDASTCMKLVQKKAKEGQDCTVPWNDDNRSILADAVTHGRNSAIVDKQGVVSLFGRDCTYRVVANNDMEILHEAKSLLPKTDFTFLQLHAMENHLKSPDRGDCEKLASVVDLLDYNVISLIEDCPTNTLVFVVCGSSDIHEVKRLNQQPSVDVERLKAAVAAARTGMVLALQVQ